MLRAWPPIRAPHRWGSITRIQVLCFWIATWHPGKSKSKRGLKIYSSVIPRQLKPLMWWLARYRSNRISSFWSVIWIGELTYLTKSAFTLPTRVKSMISGHTTNCWNTVRKDHWPQGLKKASLISSQHLSTIKSVMSMTLLRRWECRRGPTVFCTSLITVNWGTTAVVRTDSRTIGLYWHCLSAGSRKWIKSWKNRLNRSKFRRFRVNKGKSLEMRLSRLLWIQWLGMEHRSTWTMDTSIIFKSPNSQLLSLRLIHWST